jgi:hypothetical protein
MRSVCLGCGASLAHDWSDLGRVRFDDEIDDGRVAGRRVNGWGLDLLNLWPARRHI